MENKILGLKKNVAGNTFHELLKDCSNNKSKVEKLILDEVNQDLKVLEFMNLHFDITSPQTHILSTSTIFNVSKLDDYNVANVINLKKVNDARFLNKFFESINAKLPHSGYFMGKVETYPNRRQAILDKYPPVINWFIYFFDTFFTRVCPKLNTTKRVYFYLTKGKGRVVSRAEIFGRLYSCGFTIIDEKIINNSLYFVVKKINEPVYDLDPSYGPLIRLKRIGKDKREFNVYKLRTMHPFAEYLQEYVYNQNKLQEGGKIKNDFRISPEGRFFRKFWLDEIPMFINIMKGNMKLVGVRPLSAHFFSLYTEELQEMRTKFKPGLIPPFYVDLPKTMDEIMASEKKYLEAYAKAPLKTDLKYFYLSFKNILFKGARSC